MQGVDTTSVVESGCQVRDSVTETVTGTRVTSEKQAQAQSMDMGSGLGFGSGRYSDRNSGLDFDTGLDLNSGMDLDLDSGLDMVSGMDLLLKHLARDSSISVVCSVVVASVSATGWGCGAVASVLAIGEALEW